MTRFVVDLGDIAVSKDAQAAINADIQKVAMAHIVTLPPEKSYVFRLPRDWWGFILRQELEAAAEAEKQIGRNIPQLAGRT